MSRFFTEADICVIECLPGWLVRTSSLSRSEYERTTDLA